MARLLADTVVHVDGVAHWLTAGSELPVEFADLVGEHLLDGAVEVPVVEPETAEEPEEEAPAEAEKPQRGGRSGK